MENQGPLVLDISSDEDTVFGDARKGGGREFGDKEDVDWLSKLLVEVNGKDDPDDVVFLSEVFPETLKTSISESVKPSAKFIDDDDDDCVVLDGDPDKQVVVVNNKVDDDSDDLEIVGEKGEVACRDFPHARHLCAKYLFSSTPHEVHCDQCHCYVCDSLAPCTRWGTGTNSIDHCHASDKDEYWKTERKHVKKSDKPVMKIDKSVPDICTRIDSFFQSLQEPGCAPLPNLLSQAQGFNPVTIRPCAQSSNVSLPNAMSGVRRQLPGNVAPRLNSRSQLVSVQSHPRSTNTVVPRVASRNENHLVRRQNPQSLTPRAIFKRRGSVGVSTNNKHVYRSKLGEPPLNRLHAFQGRVTTGNHGSNQHVLESQGADPVLPEAELSSHNMGARCADYLPPDALIQPQLYSSCQNPDLIPHQSQPSARGNSLSSPLLKPYVYCQPSVGNINCSTIHEPYIPFQPSNHLPSQNVASWQSVAGNTFPGRWDSSSTISPSSSVGNAFGKDSCYLQGHSDPTSSLTCVQNDVQYQYHTQSPMGSSPADAGFFCASSVDHQNVQMHVEQPQYPNTAPDETSQIQNMHDQQRTASVIADDRPEQSVELAAAHSSATNDRPSTASLIVDSHPQKSFQVAAAYTSPTEDAANCQLPESREPGSFDFNFLDNWMFETESFLGAMEACALPNWDVFSPEAAFADTGTMFDLQFP